MMASQRSGGKSSTSATCWMPALLTRMSTAPNSRSQLRTMSSICAGWLMSAPWYAARPGAPRSSARAPSTSPKPLSMTLAPRCASILAMPSPMPLVEPVTRAVFPVSMAASLWVALIR